MAQDRISMPMGSAGIIGISSDTKIAGIEIDPKIIVGFTLFFVLLVKFADFFLRAPIAK
jgi:preprotein translocase subunit Sec61beta